MVSMFGFGEISKQPFRLLLWFSSSMPAEQLRPVWLNTPLRSLRRYGRLYSARRKIPAPTITSSSYSHSATSVASRRISDLGLRTQRPPDATPNPEDSSSSREIPDQEWEIRTG